MQSHRFQLLIRNEIIFVTNDDIERLEKQMS